MSWKLPSDNPNVELTALDDSDLRGFIAVLIAELGNLPLPKLDYKDLDDGKYETDYLVLVQPKDAAPYIRLATREEARAEDALEEDARQKRLDAMLRMAAALQADGQAN